MKALTVQRKKRISSIGSAALVVLLTLALVVMGITAERIVPSDPTGTSATAFAAPAMIVSPDEETEQEGDDGQSDADNAENNENNPETASDDSNTPGSERYGGGAPGGGGGGSGSDDSADPDKPGSGNQPGFISNIGDYKSVNQDTASPDRSNSDPKKQSGFDRDTDTVRFYANPNEYAKEYSVAVDYQNEMGSGTDLPVEDTMFYNIPIVTVNGKTTEVTLTLVDSKGNRSEITSKHTITFSYSSTRAAPQISVENLTKGQEIHNERYDFTASAVWDNSGSPETLYPPYLEVSFDGDKLEPQGAGPTFSFSLDFTDAYEDTSTHVVKVVATDPQDRYLKTVEEYPITYVHHSRGDNIGAMTVIVDATTVGLAPVSIPIALHYGFAFPEDLEAGLSASYYQLDSTGGDLGSFYLNGLQAPGMCTNASIDPLLRLRLELDSIPFSNPAPRDSLSQGDFTARSGWMYRVNNYMPQKSLSDYSPQPGDTLTLIFTLSWGKDIGAAFEGSGTYQLSSYCGSWTGGIRTIQHDVSVYTVIKEPTCQEEGAARYESSVFHQFDVANGRTYAQGNSIIDMFASLGEIAFGSAPGATDGATIPLPKTEHQWVLTGESVEPTPEEEGFKLYRCSICGEEKTEPWPWPG